MKKYQIIYADPPWDIKKIKRKVRPNQIQMDYPVMSLESIKALPVKLISDNNSVLFLQSYVYGEKGNFFVSTGYRQSSARIESPPWYYETFAWSLDKDHKITGMIADNSGSMHKDGAYTQHMDVIRQLHEHGKYEEKR